MPLLVRDVLLHQLDMGWRLAEHHLAELSREECLWRPAAHGLHVRRGPDGAWRGDWPDREDYGIGPSSLAWLTWHMGFWQSMALDHAFGEGRLEREAVTWPDEPDALRAWLGRLHRRWRDELAGMDEAAFASEARTRWPFTGRPFADLAAWANVELMKSAAEIGYVRFLYAGREGDAAGTDG